MRFPARPATIPPQLPEWDPAWSRIVEAQSSDGTHAFHVLDTLPTLRAAGLEPEGTIVALHGNPTWSYLWRRLARETVDAARSGGRVWRLIAPDHLEMGFSARLAHAAVTSATTTGTEATGPKHPIVTIGHDWGGVLSLGWAARNTDIVDAAISLNTAVHQPEDAPVPAPLRATLAGPMLPTATVATD